MYMKNTASNCTMISSKYNEQFARNSFAERTSCVKCVGHTFPQTRSQICSLSSHFILRKTQSNSPLFIGFRCISAITLALLLLSFSTVVSGSSIAKSECDPNDPNSCRYGATCQPQRGIFRHGKPYYSCVCPKVNCFNSGLFDPICGLRADSEKQYYNVLCLMLEECERQEPIQQLCYGMCGKKSCKAITPENMHHAPCPRENVALCQNGGLCIHHRLLNESTCRCPPGFSGNRCESKKPPGWGVEDPESKCDSKRELLTIFAIVLLGVVLILIIVCMCWRSKTSKKVDEASLWASNDTERDETTPLRDSKRSDYVFPETERKDTRK